MVLTPVEPEPESVPPAAGGRVRRLLIKAAAENRAVFIATARWVGLAGIIYGAVSTNPAIIYGFLGLLASPYIIGGDTRRNGGG